jgi:chromate transporter
MIILELIWGFFRVGLFTFGGGYAAIPLIRDVVLSYGWLSEAEITYLIAVCESTPGPVMVNMATYIGSTQAGILGSACATLAVVTPSFVIILLICSLLKNLLKNRYVQVAMDGLKPCVVGIILATGMYMVLSNCFGTLTALAVNWKAIVIAVVLVAIMILWKKLKKKKMSPILLIVLSALLGMVVYGIG